jgi:hypothetical protein
MEIQQQFFVVRALEIFLHPSNLGEDSPRARILVANGKDATGFSRDRVLPRLPQFFREFFAFLRPMNSMGTSVSGFSPANNIMVLASS